MRRKQKGGLFHPYLSGDSPNFIQSMDHKWNGSLDMVPKSANPIDHSWQWQSGTTQSRANIYSQISAMNPIPYIYSQGTITGPTPVRGGRRKTYRKNRRNRTRRYKSRRN